MAFKNIQVLLTANASNLRAQLAAAARDVDAFGKKVEGTGATAASSSKVLAGAITGTGIAIGAALGYSVKAASEFETRMRNVNSISGLSEKALSALGGEVLSLSRSLPQSANVLAEGLYEIASSGFQGAEGIKVLTAAAKAASAGLTTTAVSGKAITAVLNAYGLDASRATDVSDTLFQTVNLGVVSFEELSGVIGDTLGSAAAAKVPIEDVGAAIATMTLAGISGAESSTSLNRVLQELIKPSDKLRLVLQQLGYESGTQALEADGLRGVMEKLRIATGGNVESLLQLFPEIRAARGALALMAKEGQNYERVSGQIEDANARQGATARALKEQMKALGAQWTIFRNRANVAAIELGTRLLPAVTATLAAIQSLAKSALPTLQHGMAALAPFFRNVAQIGADLVEIAKSLVERLTPMAKVIAGIAAGAIITALNSLSTVLGTITGFLADNEGAVIGLATVLTAMFIPALVRSATALGALVLDKLAFGLFSMAGGADKAAAGLRSLGVAGTVGLAGLGVLVGVVTAAFSNANKRAQDLVATVTKNMDRSTFAGLSAAVEDLGDLRAAQLATGDSSSSFANALRGAAQVVTPMKNKVADAQRAVDELNSSMAEIDQMASNQFRNVSNVLTNLKLPDDTYESWARLRPQVEAMAKKLGVDLTQGGRAGELAVGQVVDALVTMQAQAGVTSAALVDGTTIDIAAMESMAKAVEDVTKKVGEAFASSTDFIAAFKPDAAEETARAVTNAKDDLVAARQALDDLSAQGTEKTRQQVTDEQALRKARERVAAAGIKGADEQADATQALADLEERQAAAARSSVGDQKALEKARQRVAEATDKVREAESKVTTSGGQIKTFYEEQIRLTSQFATDLTTAAEKGLDPEVLKRLLTAGPEQAAPILQALLSDNSGKLIAMVNESEDKLRTINLRVVEFARLTQKAVSAGTDQLARDLGTSMKIAAENMAQGAKATVDSIAGAIGVPSEEVRRVAAEFGITLADNVTSSFGKSVTAGIAGALKEIDAFVKANPPTPGPSVFGPLTAPAKEPARIRAEGGIDTLPAGAAIKAAHGGRGLVQWAEPETGGEAFIPLSPAKRGRSTEILTEVAKRFGYSMEPDASFASGGFLDAVRRRWKPKRLEEDAAPYVSPSGAKLVRYEPGGRGRALYADGRVFTVDGWRSTDHPGGLRFNPGVRLDTSQVTDLRRHAGGLIGGSAGADVPMVGQSGEYVLRASAVKSIGVDKLDKLNRYHQGGYVGRPMPSVSATAGGGAPIDYDRLAAAIAKAGGGTTIDARQHNEFRSERPSMADLEYANRKQAWALSLVGMR